MAPKGQSPPSPTGPRIRERKKREIKNKGGVFELQENNTGESQIIILTNSTETL